MKTSSKKNKGRQLQQWVAKEIRTLFNLPEEDCVSCPMGSHGLDIKLSNAAREVFPYAIEAKAQERSKVVYDWYEQSTANAEGLTPIVVIKKNYKKPLVVLSWEDFKELIK